LGKDSKDSCRQNSFCLSKSNVFNRFLPIFQRQDRFGVVGGEGLILLEKHPTAPPYIFGGGGFAHPPDITMMLEILLLIKEKN
jgi:hypothetical protein